METMTKYTIDSKEYYSITDVMKASRKSNYIVKRDLADSLKRVGKRQLEALGYDVKVGGRTGVLSMIPVRIADEYIAIMREEK